MFKEFVKIIGEENEERFRREVTDIILDQIRTEFEESTEYIISPDEVIEFADECKEEAFEKIKSELVAKFEAETRAKLLG